LPVLPVLPVAVYSFRYFVLSGISDYYGLLVILFVGRSRYAAEKKLK